MRAILSRWVIVGLLLLLVGCDHATKFAAKSNLEGEPAQRLVGRVLSLRYTENTDIAFNLLSWVPHEIRTPLLVVFGAVAVLALCLLLLRQTRISVTSVALMLVTAGAVGNYADRLLRGYVVDFVHLRHWPVFNIADVYVSVGAVLLAIVALRENRSQLPADG
jgi:signal peptidase II